MLQVGGSPDRIAAIKRGSVDGSLLSAIEVIGGRTGIPHDFFSQSDLEYRYMYLTYAKQFGMSEKSGIRLDRWAS